MRIAAVICELNPLHNGHVYLLERAKSLTACDAVLCVMSGNFVQRAQPAAFDMRLRTQAALLSGADAVIELPALYATACGERFSEGAVNILNAISHVTHLVFGSESGELQYLKTVASIQNEESPAFTDTLKQLLDDGKPYAAAYCNATEQELNQIAGFGDSYAPRFPNDLLAVEYCKQLLSTNSQITPLAVRRVGAGFHNAEFTGSFSSATAIRAMLQNGDLETTKTAMPQCMSEHLKQRNRTFFSDLLNRFDLLVLHALRSADLSVCPDAGVEGLAVKLKKSAKEFTDLERVIAKTKSKRYTESRIRRLCLQALFGMTHYPELRNESTEPFRIPAKLIGVAREKTDAFLRLLPSNIIVQNKDFDAYRASLSQQEQQIADYIWRVNQTAASIYALAAGLGGDPYNGLPLLVV